MIDKVSQQKPLSLIPEENLFYTGGLSLQSKTIIL